MRESERVRGRERERERERERKRGGEREHGTHRARQKETDRDKGRQIETSRDAKQTGGMRQSQKTYLYGKRDVLYGKTRKSQKRRIYMAEVCY